ncbi:hypothetical protein ABPG72_017153 [Tetrahymena utriculariae]
MNENSMLYDDEIINAHMNSIQFNEQDHLDLQNLNNKLSETVKAFTNEGINTEDVIQIQRNDVTDANLKNMQIQQQVQNFNQEVEHYDKKFEKESTLQKQKQEQLKKQSVDIMADQKKYITQDSSINKIKASVSASKDFFPLNQKETTPKTCSQIVQRKACVCHIFCLFWHGLAVYEINEGSHNTWIQFRGIQDADVFTRYVQSFYYLAVTMITVGYGDITPQTTYEILFTTVTMFVTGFFYAFSLNRIGSIIENIELKDKYYKENMQVIHRLMREENVKQTLRVQISNYLLYLYKESNEIGKQQEIEITNKLSKQLKYDLTQDIQGKYLKDIEFIDKLESKSKIVEIMEECLFSPGEYIFRQGDIDDCSLYYIVKGSVKITYDYQYRDKSESLILNYVKKSQYFGDMQFIQGNARILTAQASDFCRTYKIPREQFFQCIKQSDQDYESFQMLKEAYIFKDNQKLFNMKCYTCNKSDHISIKCPKTHLTLSKSTLIQKECRSMPHIQRQSKQRKCNKYNSIFNNLDVINGIYLFVEKDENQLNLQFLEDEMHLSLDEAFLEQQLLELEKLDFTQQLTKELKNAEITNQTISEAEQEEESTDEISSTYIYDNLLSQKKQISNANQSNLDQNQIYEAELVQDNSFIERTPSSLYNRDKIQSQSLRNKQVKSSIEKIQSSTSNSLLDQPIQQDNYYEQKNQNIEKNSTLSISTQKHQNKQQQQSFISEDLIETLENIQSQILNNLQNNDNINQNQQKKKLEISNERNNKKTLSERKKNLASKDSSFEKSEELLNHESLKEATNIILKNQPTLKKGKIKLFCKKKSQSLTDLCQKQIKEQINMEQKCTNQNKKDFIFKYNNKNNILDNKQSEMSLQILRSQSCKETSMNQIDNEQQLKQNKNYVSQTIDSRKKATNQKKVTINISSNNQFYEDSQQKSNSSLLNGSYSKQNMNNNSQSSLKNISNNEFIQKREQGSKQLGQNQQELMRQQSKKIAQIRQFKLQKRHSQVLCPTINRSCANPKKICKLVLKIYNLYLKSSITPIKLQIIKTRFCYLKFLINQRILHQFNIGVKTLILKIFYLRGHRKYKKKEIQIHHYLNFKKTPKHIQKFTKKDHLKIQKQIQKKVLRNNNNNNNKNRNLKFLIKFKTIHIYKIIYRRSKINYCNKIQ